MDGSRRERDDPPPPNHDLDESEQRAIVVPDEEQVLLHTVWIAEAYGPATVEALRSGLEGLGLGDARPGAFDPAHVRSIRERPAAVAWSSLPDLYPEGSPRRSMSLFGSVESNLPEGILRARPHWISLAPSLSVLVCAFDVDDAGANAPHTVLAGRHPTRVRRLPDGGESIVPPSEGQGRAFRTALASALDGPRAWVQANLPGEFAALGRDAPAGLLITARLFDPFDTEQTRSPSQAPLWMTYRYGAELGSGPALRNTANPALATAVARDLDGRVLWFGGQLASVAAGWSDDSDPPASDSVRAVTASAAPRLPAFIALQAVTCLLDDLYRSLAHLRDQPPERRSARHPRRQLTRALADVPLLTDARELADDLSQPLSPYFAAGYDNSDFAARANRDGAGERSFRAGHLAAIADSARALADAERRAREAVETRASLHAALAAVDATRLAILAVMLAIVAIIASIVVTVLDGS